MPPAEPLRMLVVNLTGNAELRAAQQAWAATPLRGRLRIVRRLRHELAASGAQLAALVPEELPGSLRRNLADTLVAEVLPLAEACRWLEREAEFLLAPHRQSTHARPLWLTGVSVETRRDPLGTVLIIGPGNYPLFLPGVQVLQALAAGNAVLVKPAPGGRAVMEALRLMLAGCGLDERLLTVLDESPQAAIDAITLGVNKVFLTGSASTGMRVMQQLAGSLTPSVMELSGCDAVFALEGADLNRLADALAFGMRLNGSATCMAPRRLLVTPADAERLLPLLRERFLRIPPVRLTERLSALRNDCVEEAVLYGAKLLLDGADGGPALLDHVTPDMRIARTDLFAPVLSILRVAGPEEALAVYGECPYALTAAVFGRRSLAQHFALRLSAGTVLVNDLIAPTADPRASFSGRGQSGFGSTRGPEGLLEMTAPRTVIVQRSSSTVAYQATGRAHAGFFFAVLGALHGGTLGFRLRSLGKAIRAASRLNSKSYSQADSKPGSGDE